MCIWLTLMLSGPPPLPTRQPEGPRVPTNPYRRTGGAVPGVKGRMEEIAVRLVSRDQQWKKETGDEKLRWLIEHANVTEEKAREVLVNCDFVLADAFQVLSFDT